MTTEHQKMGQEYQSFTGVDKVTGALRPLFYAKLDNEGMPVEGMFDPGSSATIISFALFQEIGKQAKLPSEVLKRPTVVLQDYS